MSTAPNFTRMVAPVGYDKSAGTCAPRGEDDGEEAAFRSTTKEQRALAKRLNVVHTRKIFMAGFVMLTLLTTEGPWASPDKLNRARLVSPRTTEPWGRPTLSLGRPRFS